MKLLKIILNINITDPAQPLFKLDFLPPHHFCHNEFLCLVISFERHVYHSEENDPLYNNSMSQPSEGRLTL